MHPKLRDKYYGAKQLYKMSFKPKPKHTNWKNIDTRKLTCYNCKTTCTPLWRKVNEHQIACNACGLYYKTHGTHRPMVPQQLAFIHRKVNVQVLHTAYDYNTLLESSRLAIVHGMMQFHKA